MPSYKYVTARNRMAGEMNGLVGDLQFARAEAIKEGQTVTICVSTNGTSCTGTTAWTNGWIVFSDPNGNQTVDAGETVFRIQPTFTSTDTLTTTTLTAISFNREGFALSLGSAPLFTLHNTPSISSYSRCLLVSVIGQLTLQMSGTGSCT
jgi:type IV fimbrial biogenesis protein FimT